MLFVKGKAYLNIDWLYPKQIEVIETYYDPKNKYQDMVLVVGMRGGKTTVASIISVYELAKLLLRGDPNAYYGLPPGSQIFIINVATSDRQAKDTVFAAIKARIDNGPFFKRYEYTEHHNEFIFPTANDGKVIVRSEHSNSSSLAGKTIILVSFDELSRFKDTGGNSSAEMVYDTLSRSVKTFKKDGRRISISSPMYENDYHMKLFRWGKNNPKVYTLQCPTWEMNPNITYESLADEFEKNPESTWRDYGAIPSKAIQPFFAEKEKIDRCTGNEENPLVRMDVTNEDTKEVINTWWLDPKWVGLQGVPYFAAGDPSFRNDAFGISVGHVDPQTNSPVIDILLRMLPRKREDRKRTEIDASLVKQFFMQVQRQCWLAKVVFDTWNYPETVQALEAEGIQVVQNVVALGEYDQLKEKIYTAHITWPFYLVSMPSRDDVEILPWELKQLERKGIKVDHPSDGSKDVADAVANLVEIMLDPTIMQEYQEPVFAFAEV